MFALLEIPAREERREPTLKTDPHDPEDALVVVDYARCTVTRIDGYWASGDTLREILALRCLELEAPFPVMVFPLPPNVQP